MQRNLILFVHMMTALLKSYREEGKWLLGFAQSLFLLSPRQHEARDVAFILSTVYYDVCVSERKREPLRCYVRPEWEMTPMRPFVHSPK